MQEFKRDRLKPEIRRRFCESEQPGQTAGGRSRVRMAAAPINPADLTRRGEFRGVRRCRRHRGWRARELLLNRDPPFGISPSGRK